MNTSDRNNIFPVPGQRILRSVLAALLCVGIYYLRGRRGAPFYSIIAALQCIQPYSVNMLKVGRNRIIGTLVGAFWGAVVLFGALSLTGSASAAGMAGAAGTSGLAGAPGMAGAPGIAEAAGTAGAVGGMVQYDDSPVYYVALALFIGIVLYSTVVLKVKESSYFSCVVFLSITMNHIGDVDPYLFVFNRTMDTILGVAAAILVNSMHLPRVRDRETLFVSGVDHVLFREDRRLSPFTKVQLNRFLQDGMRFSVSTKQTPATVREVTAGVDLRLPIIAMDGAVLYDMKTRTYLRTIKMDPVLAGRVSAFLREVGQPGYANTVGENLLAIYSIGYRLDSADIPMQALYEKKKGSPYRNYVNADGEITENVLYYLVVDRTERIRELCDRLREQPWAGEVRYTLDTFDCREGEEILRIYSCRATRREMMKELAAYTGAEKTVLFGTSEDECDVLIPDAGGGNLVKQLKKRFEPVSLRGWRNMLHF